MIELEGQIDLIDYDEILTARRDNEIYWVDGKPIKSGAVKIQFRCNVQPLGGRELLMVPENDRYREQYNFWAWGMMVKDNDIIERCGKDFQVQNLENWGSYQKGRMMLIDTGKESDD